MAFRVIEALIGAALAALGGYFAWINRGAVDGMFPPEPGFSVWAFVGGLVALIVGLVAVVHALGPRPREKARRVEETEKRARILRQAEQFYTAQAEDLASPVRDPDQPLFPEGLRPAGAPIQPPAQPEPSAEPAAPPPRPFQLHSLSQPPAPVADEAGTLNAAAPEPPAPTPEPTTAAPNPAEPPAQPQATPSEPEPEPAPVMEAQTIEPAAAATPETPPEPAPVELSARPFPASAGVIPAATEPPPPTSNGASTPPATSSGTQQSGAPGPAGGSSELNEIRTAIAEKRLDEADRLLANTRKRLNEAGTAEPIELARLTGLAGDHAAADGRLGSAKWLWRLALQRFAAAGAIDDPSAREVSERMRLADQ